MLWRAVHYVEEEVLEIQQMGFVHAQLVFMGLIVNTVSFVASVKWFNNLFQNIVRLVNRGCPFQ